MGLRFRKSISLCKGVKLNIGKTGVSISAGIPGFRKTIHSSGRVTTSVGIPGTGIYYVDTKNLNKKDNKPATKPLSDPKIPNWKTANMYPDNEEHTEKPIITDTYIPTNLTTLEDNVDSPVVELDIECYDYRIADVKPDVLVTELFENCDYPVKWIDVLTNAYPIDSNYNEETWEFLRSKVIDVFNNSGEAFIEVIERINPYDDLLDYVSEFEFEYDGEDTLIISCRMIQENLGSKKNVAAASVLIRMARDTFALLPVVTVHIKIANTPTTVHNNLVFDRNDFSKIIFENKDPYKLLSLLNTNGDI